jgi:hypothetical protein
LLLVTFLAAFAKGAFFFDVLDEFSLFLAVFENESFFILESLDVLFKAFDPCLIVRFEIVVVESFLDELTDHFTGTALALLSEFSNVTVRTVGKTSRNGLHTQRYRP